MKKKKITYSLTAKQRKEQRLDAKEKEAEKSVLETEEGESVELSDAETVADAGAAEAALKKTVLGMDIKRFIVLCLCVVLAIALIVVAVLLPSVIIPRATYSKLNNPVAVIYLSNGETLEFEIYEDEVPIAATNFLYLAKNGYFNGSIIFDRQNYYIRFGGFYDTDYNHRETDQAFSAKFTDITTNPSGKYKFQYRLQADTHNLSKHPQEAGYMSFMRTSSSTEFQICVESGHRLHAGNGDSDRELDGISFAYCLNQGVLDKLVKLYNDMDNVIEHKNYWKYPIPVVKIKKIKLYNMKKEKWKNFKFDDFFNGKISSWTGGSSE